MHFPLAREFIPGTILRASLSFDLRKMVLGSLRLSARASLFAPLGVALAGIACYMLPSKRDREMAEKAGVRTFLTWRF